MFREEIFPLDFLVLSAHPIWYPSMSMIRTSLLSVPLLASPSSITMLWWSTETVSVAFRGCFSMGYTASPVSFLYWRSIDRDISTRLGFWCKLGRVGELTWSMSEHKCSFPSRHLQCGVHPPGGIQP